MHTVPELNNPFWRFSLTIYAAPGVAAECLKLQEALDIDVNLLLFCAWLGAGLHLLLTIHDIETASATVRNWHDEVVRPLRSVRQKLEPTGRDTQLRSKVKAIELEAEQLEQAMLYEFARDRWPDPSTDSPVRSAVSENVRVCLLLAGVADASDFDSRWPGRLVEAAIEAAT